VAKIRLTSRELAREVGGIASKCDRECHLVGRKPSFRAGLGRVSVPCVIVELGEDADRLDSMQPWNTNRCERPHRTATRKARFALCADQRAACYGVIGVKFDRGTLNATEHPGCEPWVIAIEKGSIAAARLNGHNVAGQRDHAGHKGAVERQCSMKTQHSVGQVFLRRSQLAAVTMRFGDGPTRIECLIRNTSRERDAHRHVVGRERTRFG
jgi:hypothetical protein